MPDGYHRKADAGRWLACRLSAMGDVVLLSGVLDWLHKTRGWHFTVMTRRPYAALFENHPAVEGLEPVEREDVQGVSAVGYFRSVAAKYKNYGLLDLHGSLRSRLLGLFWKGAVLRYPKYSFERRMFLRKRDPAVAELLRSSSVTQRYAMAVLDRSPAGTAEGLPPAEALVPKIYLTLREEQAAADRIRPLRPLRLGQLAPPAYGAADGAGGLKAASRHDSVFVPESFSLLLPAERPVILHPYATHVRKQWPEDYWKELVRLLEGRGMFWLIVGQGKPMFPGNPADLTNTTGLRELAAVLGQGSLLVTGDSGPMHLGAAVGTPVLGLFGPTTREWGFFPAGGRDRVLETEMDCRPCSLHGAKDCTRDGECLRAIGPEVVFRAIREMI